MLSGSPAGASVRESPAGWQSLPDELQLQVLSYLDTQSLLCFGACSKESQFLAQDEQLCIDILRRHFPLAHARMAVEAQGTHSSIRSWPEQLRRTSTLHKCFLDRRALDYFEYAVGTDLPSTYAQNLGPTPRERHHSKYNFNKLVLYFTGMGMFLVVDLTTRKSVEIALPSPYSIRDIYVEENEIVVLTTRASIQQVFTYDLVGNLIRSLDTQRADLAFLMANKQFILVYSIDSLSWFYFDAQSSEAPMLEDQRYIKHSSGSTILTQALDDTYFYQKQVIGPNRSVLLIFHLDLGYVVSRISLHPGKDSVFSEICSVNRHVYLSGQDQFTHIRGLNMVELSLPGLLQEDDSPVWDSKMLADLGAWIGWMGEAEEGIPFGIFAVLLREPSTGDILDCGRLRGKTEPQDQHETKGVTLLGDERWIICVSDGRVFVWQLQR